MEQKSENKASKNTPPEALCYFADYSTNLKFNPWYSSIITYDLKSPAAKFALKEHALEVVLSEKSGLQLNLVNSQKESGKYALTTLYKLKVDELEKILSAEHKSELEKLKSRDYEIVKTFKAPIQAESSAEPGELRLVDIYDKCPVIAWFGQCMKVQNKIPTDESRTKWSQLLKEYQQTYSMPANLASVYFYQNLNLEDNKEEFFKFLQAVFKDEQTSLDSSLIPTANSLEELKNFQGEALLVLPTFLKEKEEADWSNTFKIHIEKAKPNASIEITEEKVTECPEKSSSDKGEKVGDAILIEETKN